MKLPTTVVLLAAALATGGAGSGLRAQEWIPFETIDQSALPIVRAKINGMGAHRFVLDVGFNDLLLDTLLVDGAGMELVSRGETQKIDYYGREEIVPVSYLQSLEIGKAKFELVRTLLIDGDDVTGSGGLRSYGRIGRDILEPLRLTIHYPRRLFFIEASPEDEVPAGGVAFDTAGRFIYVPVRIEQPSVGAVEPGIVENATFVLDPGSSLTVVDGKWAEKTKLVEKKSPQANLGLEMGGLRRESVPMLLVEMHSLPYDGNPAGVIGADLLTTMSVTYDFARDIVWLTAPENDPS